ncbi:MAG TPA: site-2 protease family protein [Candidatus Dormibacteraeota bacterium]|nr:site-2 protease family protein [Candidatus Dormibacteraeota bacterium]
MECFIIVTVLWVFSVCLHEFGHAAVAYRGGDYTVRDKGYLTLNPIHYTHPIYSLAMPVLFMVMGGIGLPGGAVYIERDRLRSPLWGTAVSLAGPAMNVLFIILIWLCFKTGLVPIEATHLSSIALGLLLQLQISAVILNLLPVPPLDGFQAIAPWLPERTRDQMMAASNLAMWLLFLALWYVEPINALFWLVVDIIMALLGIPYELTSEGWRAFRFWKQQGY